MLGHFFKAPAEVRLRIYQFALPVNKLFTPLDTQDYDGTEVALLTTCKLIYQEAYPVFLSRNNFTVEPHHSSDYPEGHAFFDNVCEVTFTWRHVVGIISILDICLFKEQSAPKTIASRE